jgi:hypothetical protein
MQVIASHKVGVDQGSTVLFSDFENDGEMWTAVGPRKRVTPVKFSQAFEAAPMVHVSISMWDFDQRTNARADVSAQDVTATGCNIVFRTWGDTRVARVRVDWMAIGGVFDPDTWNV